jgi:hypothetical protein
MKLRIAIHFVLIGLFAFVGAAFAQAGDAVKTEIPFDFYVGTHKMTAGTYFISLDQATYRVEISSVDNNEKASFIGIPTGATQLSEQPSLEFDHVANDYFLKRVSAPEMSLGFDVNKQEQQITGTTAVTSIPH